MTVIIMREHRDDCLARDYAKCSMPERDTRWPLGPPACSCVDDFSRPTISEGIVTDIQAERDRQDARYGRKRDDTLEPREWAQKIQRLFGELCDAGRREDYGQADHALVQIAATAVAGIEALRRRDSLEL
jgi:hypothetical protein